MNGFKILDDSSANSPTMQVIGVGGGGSNMVDHMIREGNDRVDLIVANTDAQALSKSLAKTKIQLGEKLTKGLGAGMSPEIGKAAAEESYEEILNTLQNTDIVFIGAGFGGGTGTGAAPIVAKAAKSNGSLAIGVVTTPFSFEGKKRMRLAQEGIEELKKECDSILVIPNEKLISLIDKKAGIKESFKIVDEILSQAVNGMISIVLDAGNSDINTDFADVKRIMSNRGLALMGVGVSEGENSPQEAMRNAIKSPLLDDMSIDGAKGALVHFKMSTDCSFSDINEAMGIVTASVDEDAEIIFGTNTDDSMENNRVEVTIIATGFEKDLKPFANLTSPSLNPSLNKTASLKKEAPAAPKSHENEMKAYRARSIEDYTKNIKIIDDENNSSDELDKPAYYRNKID